MPDDPLADPPTRWDEVVAAHEASLRPGTRVRIMPGECAQQWPVGTVGHRAEEYGATGTIGELPTYRHTPPWIVTHPYPVRFDGDGLMVDGSYWWGQVYAAAELILLDEPARRRADVGES